jgi:hypothetical protein
LIGSSRLRKLYKWRQGWTFREFQVERLTGRGNNIGRDLAVLPERECQIVGTVQYIYVGKTGLDF